MNEFKLGTKVEIMGNPNLKGLVIGSAIEVEGSTQFPLILVQLKEGFYNPEQTMFVRIIVAHADSLKEIV